MTMMGTPSSKPQTPHSQPQNSRLTKTAVGFMRAMRPVIQVVTKVPTRVAMAIDVPVTSKTISSDSNCKKATSPVAMVMSKGPKYGMMCSKPATMAQAPAFSRPITRRAIHIMTASKPFVTSSMNI